MTDEELRAAYRGSRELGGAAPDAPTPEEIQALVEGRGEEEERLRTLNRVLRDPELVREFELLRALHAAAEVEPPVGVEEPPPTPAPWRGGSWLTPDVTFRSLVRRAAVVLLAVGAGSWWLGSRPGPEAFRDGGTQLLLVAPAEGSRVGVGDTLVWHPLPGAERYRIELMTAEGDDLLSLTTPDTTLILPSDLPALEADRELRWWVEALLPGGELRRSPPRVLRGGG